MGHLATLAPLPKYLLLFLCGSVIFFLTPSLLRLVIWRLARYSVSTGCFADSYFPKRFLHNFALALYANMPQKFRIVKETVKSVETLAAMAIITAISAVCAYFLSPTKHFFISLLITVLTFHAIFTFRLDF